MFTSVLFTVFSLVGFVLQPALAIDQDVDPALVANLKAANTALDRMKLLPSDSDWLFDFTKQSKYSWTPGGVINADAATFPTVTGQGMTMAYLNLGPCSILPPHIHPRATNCKFIYQAGDTICLPDRTRLTIV